jgi:hypothetical protein
MIKKNPNLEINRFSGLIVNVLVLALLILFNTAFGGRWNKTLDEIDLSDSEMLPFIEAQEEEKTDDIKQSPDNQPINPKPSLPPKKEDEDEIMIKTDLDVSYEDRPFDNSFLDKMMDNEAGL